jgi:hypothetical protein
MLLTCVGRQTWMVPMLPSIKCKAPFFFCTLQICGFHYKMCTMQGVQGHYDVWFWLVQSCRTAWSTCPSNDCCELDGEATSVVVVAYRVQLLCMPVPPSSAARRWLCACPRARTARRRLRLFLRVLVLERQGCSVRSLEQ